MKRLKLTRLATLFIILCLPLSAAPFRAPQSDAKQLTGKIMGTLLDVNGSRVANAKVMVQSAKFKWEGESDEAGDFTVELPASEYRVFVQAIGFRYFESALLRVKPNITEVINIHLVVAAVTHPVIVQNR